MLKFLKPRALRNQKGGDQIFFPMLAMLSIILLFFLFPEKETSGQASDETSSFCQQIFGCEVSAQFNYPQARQFDFWIGEWETEWRPRATGDLFHMEKGLYATHFVFPILDGKAIIELVEPHNPAAKVRGFSLRYFDKEKNEWIMAQNWVNNPENNTGFLDQLRGKSRHGRMIMYSRTITRDGEEALRRLTFSDIGPQTFRWDNATTQDNGDNWSSMMVAEFSRLENEFDWPLPSEPMPTFDNTELCPAPASRKMDKLAELWEGATKEGSTVKAYFANILNGCGIMGSLAISEEAEIERTFLSLAFHPILEKWVLLRLDNSVSGKHSYFLQTGGETLSDGITFTATPDMNLKTWDENSDFSYKNDFLGSQRVTLKASSDSILEIISEKQDEKVKTWVLEEEISLKVNADQNYKE